NQITDRGGKALAEALKVNSTLTQLDLGSNQISDRGEALAEVLKVNSTLTKLNLYSNQITDRGGKALAEALKVNSTLTQLYLGFNQISDRGGEALAEALKVNNTLTQLDLERNQISDRGSEVLATALKLNNTLAQLNLSWNQISERGGEALADALKIFRVTNVKERQIQFYTRFGDRLDNFIYNNMPNDLIEMIPTTNLTIYIRKKSSQEEVIVYSNFYDQLYTFDLRTPDMIIRQIHSITYDSLNNDFYFTATMTNDDTCLINLKKILSSFLIYSVVRNCPRKNFFSTYNPILGVSGVG
ncbi:unnamed protein product, partial [Didymodactylos carnosus]